LTIIKNDLITIKQGKGLLYETTENGKALAENFKQINNQLAENP